MIPQPQNRRQYLQFGLVLLCIVCLLPTRLFLKSQSWRFPSFAKTTGTSTKRTAINNTAECRYFPQALFQFTNALHDDPENTALKPWIRRNSHSIKYPNWHFPGLSAPLLQQAFGRKTTVFVGDSTLFGLTRWMQTLWGNTTAAQQDALGRMDLTSANYAVNPEWLDQVGWNDETPAEYYNKDGTHIVWTGHRGDPGPAACQFHAIWDQIRQLRPHILVVNFGFHWLHLMGGGREVPLCAVHSWLNYEHWLETVVQVAQESGVKLLLFKTTNFVCVDKYWGEYSDAAAQYQRQDPYILSKCKREIQRLQDHHGDATLSQDDIARYCTKGVLDEYGSKDLNHRLLDFVQNAKTKTAMTMEIFNDHDVQSCPYSEPNDGRHYHPLNLLRIRLLANQIQCLYPE